MALCIQEGAKWSKKFFLITLYRFFTRRQSWKKRELHGTNGTLRYNRSRVVRLCKGWSFEMEKTAICTREKYNRRVAGARSKKCKVACNPVARSCDILRRVFLVFVMAIEKVLSTKVTLIAEETFLYFYVTEIFAFPHMYNFTCIFTWGERERGRVGDGIDHLKQKSTNECPSGFRDKTIWMRSCKLTEKKEKEEVLHTVSDLLFKWHFTFTFFTVYSKETFFNHARIKKLRRARRHVLAKSW